MGYSILHMRQMHFQATPLFSQTSVVLQIIYEFA